jgi:molecular chaperone GrpE
VSTADSSGSEAAGVDPGAETEVPVDATVTDDAEASAEDQLDEAVDVLLKLQAERDEFLEQAQRATADHANARKRWERERAQIVERAEEKLATSLLVVLDALDSALAHGSEDVAPIQVQLMNTLTAAGLARVDETEVPFDPHLHSAVSRVESDNASADEVDVVAQVMRPGYTWRGNLLRPAMVSVRG